MTPGATIKVLIADDHAILRTGLKRILGEAGDIVVAGEAENGTDALHLARQGSCDVLLLDISMPGLDGFHVLRQVKADIPLLPVLILSMHQEDQYAIRALRYGAAGYLNKARAAFELVHAIRQVARGGKYITAQVAQALAERVGEELPDLRHECLSAREYQTLTMIASGETVGKIAEELGLSVKTVSMYRTRVLEKMKLRHNAELTHYAIKHQLVR